MKKDNVLQYAVAITGIIFGYQLIQSYLFIILNLVGWVIDGGRGSDYWPALLDMLSLLLKTFLCLALIFRSGEIAAYIINKGNMGTQLSINIRPSTLLQILFISIGLYFFIASLPLLLNDVLDSLREKNGVDVLGRPNVVANRYLLIIQTILAALAMGLSKPLSAYFAKQFDKTPISITQNIDNISTTDSADMQ
jgi:hypothetical protein